MIIRLKPLPIRFHCYKVLPLVYDEALSYYEQLCKVTKTVNDSVEAINDLNTAVTDITGNVTQLNDRVNSMVSEIAAFEDGVNAKMTQINDLLDEYDTKFSEYDSRFNDLETRLTAQINNNVKALKDYIDSTLAGIEAEIKTIIEKEIKYFYDNIDKITQDIKDDFELTIKRLIDNIPDLTTIEVINPVTGRLSKVQIALDDLFMNTRYNALTVDEFNHLHLSVNDCNTLMYRSASTGWSVITWLTEAKELFDKSLKHRMANALTGAWQDFKKSIEENTDMLRVCGCLTVSEFGGLGLTVDAFNEIGATCEELAWKSNRIFG